MGRMRPWELGKRKIGRGTDGLVGARKRGAEVGRKRGEGGGNNLVAESVIC